MKKKNKRIGSSIDGLLKEEGIFEETQEQAIKEVIASQLSPAMEKKHISKSIMATRLKTRRTQANRILHAQSDVLCPACNAPPPLSADV